MILRHYINCDTCNHAHTLRIQVGGEPYQEHSFSCVECGEEIIIGMHCYPDTGSVNVKEVENARLGDKEGSIVNLSPWFPIQSDDLHRDLAFPSIEHIKAIAKEQLKLASLEDILNSSNKTSLSEAWGIIKKGWSLTNKERDLLAKEQLKKYLATGYDGPIELNSILFDFCLSLLSPNKINLFKDAAELRKSILTTHKQEYERFKNYYKENIKNDNLLRYFNVYSEYFKSFNDFSQTLTFHQYGIELPDDFVASSYAFDKTKLFYGNAYEALTSNIVVLACLNNISKNRNFETFEQMNLSKYLTINKANRANPFQDIPEFLAITDCLDSTLRNASHHGSSALSGDGKTIHYQSGGTGARRSISYKQYIDKCNDIMLSSSALLAIELIIGL